MGQNGLWKSWYKSRGIRAQDSKDCKNALWILLQRSPEWQTTQGTFSRKQELQFLMMKMIEMIKSKEAKMLNSRRMIAWISSLRGIIRRRARRNGQWDHICWGARLHAGGIFNCGHALIDCLRSIGRKSDNSQLRNHQRVYWDNLEAKTPS